MVNIGDLIVAKAMTTEVGIKLFLYLLNIASYGLAVYYTKHATVAMAQIEMYIREITKYGLVMCGIVELWVRVDAVELAKTLS